MSCYRKAKSESAQTPRSHCLVTAWYVGICCGPESYLIIHMQGAMTLHGIKLDPEVQAKVVAVVTYGVSVLARRVLLRSDFAAGPNHRRSP